jgi:hypothetical protein
VSDERWWTLDEANEALPRIAAIVVRARASAEAAQQSAEALIERVQSNGHGSLPFDLAPIQEALDALNAEGIVLRDIEQGLVDFPARATDGRPFWLCWVVGEPEVAFWHWPEDGFGGRAPISDLP